jgi:hypothetical protein
MRLILPRLLVAVALCSSAAFAQTNASSKASVKLSETVLIPKLTVSAASGQGDQLYKGEWENILSTTMKSSSNADVLIGVSLEAGLFTDTLVASKGGEKDTSQAEASIEIRVLVDGKEAAPGPVIFAQREQSVMAVFGGVLQSCTDSNFDGTIVIGECILTDEQLQLVLNTMNANAFNFSLINLGTGIHNFDVEARIVLRASAQAGSASAAATVGKGALTVEAVRFVNSFEL